MKTFHKLNKDGDYMYCAQCGSQVGPDDKFCEQCGKPISKIIQKAEPAKALVKKSKGKKAGIIAGSTAGGLIAIVALAFFLLNFFSFPILQFMGFGDDLWQYDKKIKKPITALSADQDITLGEIETHGVSVDIPSQAFDSDMSVTLSHPDKKPQIDNYAFAPLGAPITVESTGQQKRLNRPLSITMSIDSLERDRSGALYVAVLNERNGWDYITPDKIDLQKRLVTFKTYRLGTYGFVNLKKEKLIEEFTRQRAVRQWTEHSLEFEAKQARDEVVRDILQDKLGILDESILENVRNAVANDCPASKLVISLVDKDAAKFTQAVATSAGRHIPKAVEPMILKEALENVASQPWASGISEKVSDILEQGNLTQATVQVIEGITSEFIVDRVEKVWVDLADRKVGIWNSPEIEKSYQVFKGGTQDQDSLWGYKTTAGNFDELWSQMRGVAEEIVDNEINSYIRVNNKKPDELKIEEKNKIREDARLSLKKQFEERMQQETEIGRIERKNIIIAELLDKKSLLKTETSNPSFEEQDDIASLINRIYIKIEDIKRDTGRFEIIHEEDEAKETEKYNPETMIKAQELVDLVYIWYDKGEDAYRQAVEQRGLVKEEVAVVQEEDVIIEVINMSLDGKWKIEEGAGIIISGSTAVFYSFSPNWQAFADAGLIKPGDLKLKDIVKISDNQWECLELYMIFTGEGTPDYTTWSDWATITMSDDGKTITINSQLTNPETGLTGKEYSYIFYRVTDEQDLQKQDTQEQVIQEQETAEQDTQEQETGEQATDISLDGEWEGPYGFIIKISESTSVFISFSPGMQEYADAGMVSLGDLQMKDIVQISENQWTCSVLYFFSLDNKPYAVGWSDEATITMADDGNSFTTQSKATHPKTGKALTSSSEYNRKSFLSDK